MEETFPDNRTASICPFVRTKCVRRRIVHIVYSFWLFIFDFETFESRRATRIFVSMMLRNVKFPNGHRTYVPCSYEHQHQRFHRNEWKEIRGRRCPQFHSRVTERWIGVPFSLTHQRMVAKHGPIMINFRASLHSLLFSGFPADYVEIPDWTKWIEGDCHLEVQTAKKYSINLYRTRKSNLMWKCVRQVCNPKRSNCKCNKFCMKEGYRILSGKEMFNAFIFLFGLCQHRIPNPLSMLMQMLLVFFYVPYCDVYHHLIIWCVSRAHLLH